MRTLDNADILARWPARDRRRMSTAGLSRFGPAFAATYGTIGTLGSILDRFFGRKGQERSEDFPARTGIPDGDERLMRGCKRWDPILMPVGKMEIVQMSVYGGTRNSLRRMWS